MRREKGERCSCDALLCSVFTTSSYRRLKFGVVDCGATGQKKKVGSLAGLAWSELVGPAPGNENSWPDAI